MKMGDEKVCDSCWETYIEDSHWVIDNKGNEISICHNCWIDWSD